MTTYIKDILMGLLLMIGSQAQAEGWFCTEESSTVIGSYIQTCGIGKGNDEADARSKAFDNAKIEFTKICGLSSNCKGHRMSVEPMRTTCSLKDGWYTCHRMLMFNIDVESKPELTNNVTSPTIKVGMTKDELIGSFGTPHNVHRAIGLGGNYLQVFYRGTMCESESCYAIITNGTVSSYQHFKPKYTEDMN